MKAMLFGRKPVALEAFDWLSSRGHEVVVVVPERPEPPWAPRPTFAEGLRERRVRAVTQADLLRGMQNGSSGAVSGVVPAGTDLVVSYLFPERVRGPLLELPSLGAVNFHPAPLPEYGGLAGYNLAILEGAKRYGVTAHYMVEGFDRGPVIERTYFDIDPDKETALSLEMKTRPVLLALFRRVIERFENEGKLPAHDQKNVRYVNKAQFEAMKWVDLQNDSPETIARKIRAFWYPPYHGAKIRANDREFTLVSVGILGDIGKLLHGSSPADGCQDISGS